MKKILRIKKEACHLIEAIKGKELERCSEGARCFLYSIGGTPAIKYDPYICMRDELDIIVNTHIPSRVGEGHKLDLAVLEDKRAFFEWVVCVESWSNTPNYNFTIDWDSISDELYEISDR